MSFVCVFFCVCDSTDQLHVISPNVFVIFFILLIENMYMFLYIKREWATSLSSLLLCVHCDIIKCCGDMWSPSACWWWDQISLHSKMYGTGGLAVAKNLLTSCEAIVSEAEHNNAVDVLIWMGTKGLFAGGKVGGTWSWSLTSL